MFFKKFILLIFLIPHMLLSQQDSLNTRDFIVRYVGDVMWLCAADMNNDDLSDVVVAENDKYTMAWYEAPDWNKHIITDKIYNIKSGCVVDMDDDNDLDVIATAWWGNAVVWFEAPEWIRHDIARISGNIVSAGAADMDNDGDMDVVAASYSLDDIYWFEAPAWEQHTIDANLYGVSRIVIADLDVDDTLDVAAVGSLANDVVWYEGLSWDKHIIDADLDYAYGLDIADMNGDNLPDVIASAWDSDDVLWYQAPGWDKMYIDQALPGPGQLKVGDVDNDGNLDVVVNSYALTEENCKVVSYEAPSWDMTVIDENIINPEGLCLADMNNSGDLEVIVSEWKNRGSIHLYGMGNYQFAFGPQFQSFIDNIYSLEEGERQVAANNFLSEIEAFPFIEQDSIVCFIYTGNYSSVCFNTEINKWDENQFQMIRIPGTDFWYYPFILEPDALIEYKFICNGSSWTSDPRNPNTNFSNSYIAMPYYVYPEEIDYYDDIPHGNTYNQMLYSATLKNTRNIKVYTPPTYETSDEDFPVILFHDGLEYANPNIGAAVNVLDFLIHENRILPCIAVFVPPVSNNGREEEYVTTYRHQFEDFIINELMVHIDTTYRTSTDPACRAMLGMSFGAVISSQICYNNPDKFGLCAVFSPAYWIESYSVYDDLYYGSAKNLKMYIDYGTYDAPLNANDPRLLIDVLEEKGYTVLSNIWHEGHTWLSWRSHIDNALEYFFPYVDALDDEEHNPLSFELKQNYPNPFNPKTVIRYTLPVTCHLDLSIYNILGQKVAILVNKKQPAGWYKLDWDASGFTSGVYFYRLSTNKGYVETKKLLLLK